MGEYIDRLEDAIAKLAEVRRLLSTAMRDLDLAVQAGHEAAIKEFNQTHDQMAVIDEHIAKGKEALAHAYQGDVEWLAHNVWKDAA